MVKIGPVLYKTKLKIKNDAQRRTEMDSAKSHLSDSGSFKIEQKSSEKVPSKIYYV